MPKSFVIGTKEPGLFDSSQPLIVLGGGVSRRVERVTGAMFGCLQVYVIILVFSAEYRVVTELCHPLVL
jgi:hypothetical protein